MPLRASRLNGARMPSIAEDVATDLSTVRSRTAGSRKYRLVEESFELMVELYQARLSIPTVIAMMTRVPPLPRLTHAGAGFVSPGMTTLFITRSSLIVRTLWELT